MFFTFILNVSQGTSLQKELKDDEKEITNLEDDLKKVQDDYQNMYDAMQYKCSKMEVLLFSELMLEKKPVPVHNVVVFWKKKTFFFQQ